MRKNNFKFAQRRAAMCLSWLDCGIFIIIGEFIVALYRVDN